MTSPSPPSRSRLGASLRAAGGWILRVLLWTVVVIGAASLGGPLAVVGLSGVALALAAGLVLLGATSWRRAGLPLSLTAAALALTAAVVAAQPVRIDHSHGLLLAKPARPADVQPEYRRGIGNVVLDLRDFRAPARSGTTFNLRSDTGRVVVALPRERCFTLQVELARGRGGDAVLFEAPLAVARSVAGYSTGVASLHGQQGVWDAFPEGYAQPESPTRLIAFGKTVFVPGYGADQRPFFWQRLAPQPGAPTLRIKADVATDLIVRDYPDGVGPAFSVYDAVNAGALNLWGSGQYAGQYADPTQVSDVSWPETVQPPASPGDRRWRDRLQARPRDAERADRQERLWSAWFQRARGAAQQRSELAAGGCATQSEQAAYWSRFSFTRFRDRAAATGVSYTVAVNGRGQTRLYRDSYTSAEPDYLTLKPGDDPFTNPAILKELAS